MSRRETLQIARLWAAAAWADDKLHPAEAAALRRFIEASDDLGDEERHAALDLLSKKPDVEVGEIDQLEKDARQGVYRAALGIVRLDGAVTTDEIEWLAELRNRLKLDATTVDRIDREA